MAAALFSLTVSILLIANYIQVRAITPIDNPALLALRQQLAAAPEPNPELTRQIEALDLLARKAFFTSQAHLKTGGYLLLGGVIVLLAALRAAARFRPRVPDPGRLPGQTGPESARSRARLWLGVAGGTWVVVALFAAFLGRLDIPAASSETAPAAASSAGAAAPAAPAYPDWEALQRNWPAFRGPGGYGVAHHTTAPIEWDGAAGKNVKWAVDIPLPGANSPVVWEKRVFLTGATEAVREIYCFDADSGAVLWKRALEKIEGTPEKPLKVNDETGFAAPTMVAHGDRVCAIFANGDLVCYDMEGNLKWAQNLGLPNNHYGHSSSLLAYQNLLFVQYDQNTNGRLLAVDLADGHPAWSVSRGKISWASPICVATKFGQELVVNSESNVDSYDPLTGKPLWQLECLDGEVAPSPAYGGGMFFVANDNAYATGIKFDDAPEPKPAMAWQWDEALPDVSSPVGTDTYFYVATSRGEIACLDHVSGQVVWGQEYDEGFYASPILVGDRIYAFDKKGTAFVFKTGSTYELIATCPVGEGVMATPAFLDGRIYIRTEKRLLCIGNP